MAGDIGAETILDYWKSLGQEGWFNKDEAVDRGIGERFAETHAKAAAHALDDWRQAPDSCLALVIMLDQFSRNMFREDGRAFAQDSYALELANHALVEGFDKQVEPALRSFFFMPFMHSECIGDQQRCIALFHGLGGGEALKHALVHHDIIARFGRFPHRNPLLGRHTTPAEQAYLDGGGFGAPKNDD